jgi:hypothetical protein
MEIYSKRRRREWAEENDENYYRKVNCVGRKRMEFSNLKGR